MTAVEFNKELCKGCLLCTSVCPAKIISPSAQPNSKGYFPVEVTEDKQGDCKQCGFCHLICPDAVITVYKKEGAK